MKPLPCPCCESENLHKGIMNSSQVGIHCWECNLTMAITIPNIYPKDFPKELTGKEAIDKLRELTLLEAIKRWNTRFGETQPVFFEILKNVKKSIKETANWLTKGKAASNDAIYEAAKVVFESDCSKLTNI